MPLCQPLAHVCEFSVINGNVFSVAESVSGFCFFRALFF